MPTTIQSRQAGSPLSPSGQGGRRSGHKVFHEDAHMENIQESSPRTGFGFDLELDDTIAHSPSLSPVESPTANESKKVGELASMFLETRKALQVDCNILDPINDGDSPTVAGTEISRKTIIRAERVKSMISVKYICLQKLYDIPPQDIQHPGIEGVYNPLQIIRNRKLRTKHGEYPKPLSIKTLPLASNVFSKNNLNPKKPWKMIWAVELPEFVGDPLWCRGHWHELKNAKGQLWFPPDRHSSTSSSSSGENKQRLHDKIFNDDLKEDAPYKLNRRRHSVSTATSNDSDGHFFKITSTRSPMRLKDRMRRHPRRKTHSSSSSNAGDDDEAKLSTSTPMPKDPLKDQFFKRLSSSPERTDTVARQQDPRTPPAPKLRITSPTQDFDVNDIPIKSVDRRIGSLDDSYDVIPLYGDDDATGSPVNDEVVKCLEPDLRVKELQQATKNFNYFERVISLRMNYVINIYPHLTKTIDHTLDQIIQQQMSELFQLAMKISDEHLPIYEQLYSGFLNEVKAINHLINDDYSIKIDNLLSTSDRSMGEINTSLSLELRKINERIDKLNSSLFSNNVVTETFKDSDLNIKLKDGNHYKILYSALENLIVILLKFIWVIVNIYKFFAFLVRIVIKVFRFILF